MLGDVHLVVLEPRKVSAVGRSSAGAGLRRQQVVAGRHLAELDDAVPLVGFVRGGAVLGDGARVGLRLELEVVPCVLAKGSTTRVLSAARLAGARGTRDVEGEAGRRRDSAGPRQGRGVPWFFSCVMWLVEQLCGRHGNGDG